MRTVSVLNTNILGSVANTSSRTLRLLSLLQNHRHWSGDDLARRLEVSARTVRRDVERLRDLGYPVEAARGVDGGYQLAAGAAMPPLVLDDDEAVAIVVGLQAGAQAGIEGIAESSVRALAKVAHVMPTRLRRRVDALRTMTVPGAWSETGSHVDPERLTTIAQACRDSERLEISYTDKAARQSLREIEPHRLVLLGRRWYLVAYDLSRHDWRSFRVDRIEAATATGTFRTQRTFPAEDALAFVRAGIEGSAPGFVIEVIVEADVETVRGAVGRWATVEARDAQHTVLRMTSDSLDWPALTLGSIGADFTVVSPPELVAHLHAWGQRFGRVALATGDERRTL